MTNTTALDLESIAQHEAIEAAVDQHYPKQDSPHASVRDRIGAARLAFRKGYRAALAAKGQQEPVAGQWVRCTPDLMNAGVSCANTPRRDGDGTYSHDHFISHCAAPVAQQSEAGAPPAANKSGSDLTAAWGAVWKARALAAGWAPEGRESAAPAVAGFTTAPIYPTKEMIEAAENTGDLYRMGSPNLWADVWRNMLRAAPAAPVREGDREQDAKGWSQEPPTEQGEYWHWNGDEDTAPYIYHILWSGTAKKCFVSIGQYGITEASFCDEFGGWWKKITQPSVPLNAAMQKGAQQ